MAGGHSCVAGRTAYERSRVKATAAVQALGLRLIAGRLEHGEAVPGVTSWRIERQNGSSHRILERSAWPAFLFACHDRVTPGPAAMKVRAKRAGLRREDLCWTGQFVQEYTGRAKDTVTELCENHPVS